MCPPVAANLASVAARVNLNLGSNLLRVFTSRLLRSASVNLIRVLWAVLLRLVAVVRMRTRFPTLPAVRAPRSVVLCVLLPRTVMMCLHRRAPKTCPRILEWLRASVPKNVVNLFRGNMIARMNRLCARLTRWSSLPPVDVIRAVTARLPLLGGIWNIR